MKKILIFVGIMGLAGLLLYVYINYWPISEDEDNTNQEEEPQEIVYKDLIKVSSPKEMELVSSPLIVKGEARGNWYFEATFPVTLTDWDGRIIAETYATAQSDWMTENYVPFEVSVEFESPVFPSVDASHFSRRGALILQKSNASGLPEHDDAVEITVWFE